MRSSLKRYFVLALLFFACEETRAFAAQPDYASEPVAQLIDELSTIDHAAPGISDMASYRAFIGDGSPMEFTGGVLGVTPPSVPLEMRELVRRGAAVLPALISHIKDPRPTRLTVGQGGILMWGYFGQEYDPRFPTTAKPSFDEVEFERKVKEFPGKYIVKIGDVCYALIGQIVNRQLSPVRYQPTGGIVINSPVVSSALAEHVSSDWGKLTISQHRESLLGDIAAARRTYQFAPAFARLQFYYPDTYRSLSGLNAEKRAAFEENNQAYLATE